MELIGIIIGGVTVLFASWGTLWYKMGRLEQKIDNCNKNYDEMIKKVNHLIAKGG